MGRPRIADGPRKSHLPAKIRVYELARELGLTNKETLDLCVKLGIGVNSHSSSIVDAQADRVRRRADRDGLIRPPEPEPEPEPEPDPLPYTEPKTHRERATAR
ncbi:MAG: hypothetical protein F4124_09945 [Acidimicrobiia bacterium]|nr:hypothetical protein [Acidimicrobiia bacterium]